MSLPRYPKEPAWTVDQACAYFAAGGVPIEPGRLRLLIKALKIRPVAETPPGERGGRGQSRYDVGELMSLHASVAPWLAAAQQAEDQAAARDGDPRRRLPDSTGPPPRQA